MSRSEPNPNSFPRSAQRLRRLLLIAAVALLPAGSAGAQQTLLDEQASYTFQDQSMWGPGEAFIFDFAQFVGIDTNPSPVVVGAGTGDRVSVPTPLGTYSINPYFQFDTDFRLGVELGASINSGSVDGNLDYGVSFTAPDEIRVGESFSLQGSAAPLASSGFVTRAPTAEAYLDGILEAYVGGYARVEFVKPGILADEDLRWGNRGFTINDTNNRPYATLANINERQEIISINRDQSGVIRYLGGEDLTDGDLLYDELGKGSSVSLGPISLTAGNIDVVANGALVGGRLVGDGQDTLATMTLDIDHLLLGSPALGLSISHDWGAIDYSLGYDIVNLDTALDVLLQQSFAVDAVVLVELLFSEDILLDGVGQTNRYLGPIDAIPLMTLLGSDVDVEATLLVDAILSNDTGLGFIGSLGTTLLEASARVGWNVSGNTGSRSVGVGPVYENTQSLGLGDITVYSDSFSLGLTPVDTWSFQLTSVPEPSSLWLVASGLLGLFVYGSRRPSSG